ncbi:hypothetical protein EC968_010255 [Mortierella alpina]|nr:hypothetical protein EC968_010255 [Mortierella alpina]
MASNSLHHPAAEPYNVWSDVQRPSNRGHGEPELDMEELYTIEQASSSSGGSPTRYSAQTIRQKKGRKLVSTMRSGSIHSDDTSSSTTRTSSAEFDLSELNGMPGKQTTTNPVNNKAITTDTIEEKKASNSTVHKAAQAGFGQQRTRFPSVGLYQGLGRLQAYSAMAFGSFALIHMVPPVLASVGGLDLADKGLMWGRVYYQTYGVEQVLVFGSLAVHIGAGLCKAAIRLVWRINAYYASTAPTTASETTRDDASGSETTIIAAASHPNGTGGGGSGASTGGSAPGLFPYHRLVGWLLTPIVLGHMDTMRMAPLKVLGDSSLVDYSFVSYLHRIGRPSPYVLLVGFLAYHMVSGGPVAFNMALPKGSERRIKARELIQSRKVRAAVAGMVTVVAMVGVYRIMTAEGVIPMSKIYARTSQEGARHQKLEKQREKMMSEFEQQRAQIVKDAEVKVSSDKFVAQHDNVEEALKKSTIGLVHLKDFRKVRQELEELKKREAAKTYQIQDKVVKKKSKKVISKLSFADEEEEEGGEEALQEDQETQSTKKRSGSSDDGAGEGQDDDSSSNNKPSPSVFKKSKFGKDPNIDTSFLPDREREEEERRVREDLRQEWLRKQEEIKKETIQITYSYWDGSGHRKEVECKKGDTIAQFLEKCRQQFQQLRGVSIDNLMYVKEDLIIPHHYTFYDFIINKARGKSGPLFSFDVHEDIRLTNDANVEKDESHAGKVVERSYYERNKHIFPLSRFEIYDPEKDYGKYSIKGRAK